MAVISVIVPVYNVEKYLDRCVSSIIKQTFKDIEIILIDDGSSDNCPCLCDAWSERDDRIVVIHQENQGLSAARNAGIRLSKGDYLTFVDSDDWISNTMLDDLFLLLKKNNADISICNMVKTDGEITTLNRKFKEYVYNKDEFMKIMLRVEGNRCVHYAWGKLYSRQVIDLNNHYPIGMLNEDVEGMFKAIILSNKIVETTKIGYYYFNNSESISKRVFGENFLSLHEVWSRILIISQKDAPEYYDYVNYNMMRSDFTILVDMILYGNSKTDKIYFLHQKEIKDRLKLNLPKLLASPMQINRKILMILVCFFYKPLKLFLRLIKNVLR